MPPMSQTHQIDLTLELSISSCGSNLLLLLTSSSIRLIVSRFASSRLLMIRIAQSSSQRVLLLVETTNLEDLSLREVFTRRFVGGWWRWRRSWRRWRYEQWKRIFATTRLLMRATTTRELLRVEFLVDAAFERTFHPVVRVHVHVFAAYISVLVACRFASQYLFGVIICVAIYRRCALIAYFAEFDLKNIVGFTMNSKTLVSTRAKKQLENEG
jgi:hypothetical protein